MAKPQTEASKAVQPPQSKYEAPAARRVRVIRRGNNIYDVVEETWDGPPTSVKVLKAAADRTSAEYRVRLWLETFAGPQRHGDSGL